MKKSKSVFSLFLTLALVLSLLPALSPAARAEDPVSGLFHYQLNADGQTVTITNDVYYLFTAGTHFPGIAETLVAARRRDRPHGPVAELLWAYLRQAAAPGVVDASPAPAP